MTALFSNALAWIFSWVGNYGWSVVIFTLVIRFILLPLDIKSKKSMRAMSKIQPQMQALQKKYANDKDKLNMKMQELYKKEHVSPFSGCLPMLIQMPILFVMFAAMRTVANEHTIQMILDMKNGLEPQLQSWLWIKNVFQPDSFTSTILPQVGDTLKSITAVGSSKVLTAENLQIARDFLTTDAYAALAANYGANMFSSMTLNLVFFKPTLMIPTSFAALFQYANGLFILPIFAGISQFFMTKVTAMQQPKKDPNAEAAPDPTGMNSGFMKWFFPLFSLYICASYNAAFAIYWMAVNVIQILQQLAVNWYFERKDREAAAKAEDDFTK